MKIKPTDITDFIASKLGFTPSGSISSTNVQDAIHELDSDISSKVSTSTLLSDPMYLSNKVNGLASDDIVDLGMLGLFDRNILTDAAYRATVTPVLTGSGTLPSGTANTNLLFNAGSDFYTITGTDETTTQFQVTIDMGANVPNYSRGWWQPFVVYRRKIGTTGSRFDSVLVEMSTNGTDWKTQASSAWDIPQLSQVELAPGLWFGKEGPADTPSPVIATWRYVRFTFTNRVVGVSTPANIYFVQLGIRQLSEPFAKQYARTVNPDFVTPVKMKTYSKATLPAQQAGAMIYVSDATGGASIAFSNGTNWISVITGNPV